MMEQKRIKFLDQVFVRRPFFSSSAYSVAKLKDVLCLNVFRNALWLSSPAFYQELEKKNFDFELLSKKERLTALKFYNRMSFRGTPFGAFSGFGLASWTAGGQKRQQVADEAVLRLLPSVERELMFINGEPLKDSTLLVVNPTLYKLSSGWRYTRYENEKQGKLSFFVYLLDHNEADEMLLARLGSDRITLIELISYLEDLTDANNEDCRLHILKLLDEQVLISDKSLSLLWGNDDIHERSLENNNELDLNGLILPDRAGADGGPDGKSFYAGLELRNLSGLNEGLKIELQETIKVLDLLAPIPPKNTLDKFMESFEQKFGERRVPLLEALDPDLGIAYDGTNHPDEHELLKGLQFPQGQRGSDHVSWSPVHKLLLKVWLQNNKRNEYEPILLRDEDLSGLTPSGLSYPPSFSVLCSLGEEKLILHNSGGATANALIGRFSVFGGKYSEYCKSVAKEEQGANPDVMFAEILQLSHRKIDNINRRSQVYDQVIPLNCFPVPGSVLPSDIDVCIKLKEIVLIHRATGKRVIPRLPTAFNFHHNGMPLFKFLCALQFKGIRTNFDFDPEKLFPGLAFYPRIEYRRIVLSLARWHLSKEEIAHLTSGQLSISRLHLFCRDRGIPVKVAVGRGDQQLVFDLSKDDEAMFFLESLRDASNPVITEFPDATAGEANGLGRFNHQYAVSLINQETVYFPSPATGSKAAVARDFAPGTEWVYLKIYTTYESANVILLGTLVPWIQSNRMRIQQWFFVRYYDTDSHLRIRFRVALVDVKDIQFELQSLILNVKASGLVQKAYFDTYQREIERYSAGLILKVEEVFFAGSECVSRYLAADLDSGGAALLWPIMHCYRMVSIFYNDDKEKIFALCTWVADAFFKEHGGDKQLKRSMDTRFRELRPALTQLIDKKALSYSIADELQSSLRSLSVASLDRHPLDRNRLIADLVHMQVNRIFSFGQRRHEAFIWHCLLKLISTSKSKQAKNAVVFMDDR